MAISIAKVNMLTRSEFNERFANILEHCPECAEDIERHRPFSSMLHLHSTLCDYLDNSTDARRIVILRGLPDLAGKLARFEKFTKESSKEQCIAGLDNLTTVETEILYKLNEQYKEKFGIPFVLCARENKKDAIMKGIAKRLGNSVEHEMFVGIEEIKKISFYRILDLVVPEPNKEGIY